MADAFVKWTVTNNAVTSVELAGFPAGCNGASAWVTLTDSSSTDLGSGSSAVTVSGGSAVFTSLTGNPAPGTVATVHFSLVGP